MTNRRIQGRLSDEKRDEMQRLAAQIDAEKDEMRQLANQALARRLAEAVLMLADCAERGATPPPDRLRAARELAQQTLWPCDTNPRRRPRLEGRTAQ